VLLRLQRLVPAKRVQELVLGLVRRWVPLLLEV
jgi:hypothetical protein